MQLRREDITEQTMAEMGRIFRFFMAMKHEYFASQGLSSQQAQVLFALKHHSLTVQQLANYFSITPSAASQMIEQLEEKKLVQKQRDTADQRVVHVSLSDHAREPFEDMRCQFLNKAGSVLDGISTNELQTLLDTLTKITVKLGKEPHGKN